MKTEERTFVAIKPDGVKRGFIGKIIERFENKGFKIVAMKLLQVTPELHLNIMQSIRANLSTTGLFITLQAALLLQWLLKVTKLYRASATL